MILVIKIATKKIDLVIFKMYLRSLPIVLYLRYQINSLPFLQPLKMQNDLINRFEWPPDHGLYRNVVAIITTRNFSI